MGLIPSATGYVVIQVALYSGREILGVISIGNSDSLSLVKIKVVQRDRGR